MSPPPDPEPLVCPSAPCRPGASLIAVRGADGRMAHVTPALPVDAEFVARAAEPGPPEARMRFSSPCLEDGCAQWTGSRCGVIAAVLDTPLDTEPAGPLPRCAIRPHCRWHRQEGAAACRACPLVVTDARALA